MHQLAPPAAARALEEEAGLPVARVAVLADLLEVALEVRDRQRFHLLDHRRGDASARGEHARRVVRREDAGQVVERGTHSELLALNGRYKQLYDKQYKFEMDRFINPGEDFTPEPDKPAAPVPRVGTAI